jgi:hypothetical protein
MSRKSNKRPFALLLLIPTFLTGVPSLIGLETGSFGLGYPFTEEATNSQTFFTKPSDMGHCNSDMPKCPLCPSSNSSIQLVRQEVADYLPTPISSFILFTLGTLSDQGFIKTIFHPPIYVQKPLIS